MLKLLCGLVVGGFLGYFSGSGSYKYFIPDATELSSNETLNTEHFEFGSTRFGESCKTTDKWEKDLLFTDARALHPITKSLLNKKWNSPSSSIANLKEHGFKHVCFLNIDMLQYKIDYYARLEKSTGYGEIFEFRTTNESAECTQFEYYRDCEYTGPTEIPKCIAAGQCMDLLYEENLPNEWVMIMPFIIFTLVMLLVTKCNSMK